MEGLPADILRLILLRVPLASLAGSVRRVCRSWRALVDDDPSLALGLLSSSPSGYLSRHSLRRGCWIVCLLTYVSVTDHPNPEGEMAWSMAAHPFDSCCAVEQSHHGLLLVTRGEERLPAYLWNPLLDERNPLPGDHPELGLGSSKAISYRSGFGFDASAGLYKVFRMAYHNVHVNCEAELLCEVCTVGAGQRPSGWRRIAGPGPVGPFCFESYAILVDGRIYWAVASNGRRTVISVDIRTESFAQLGGLPCGAVWHAACLGGHLALHVKWPEGIWVMKEHGTWTKESGCPQDGSFFVLLGSWKDGTQIHRCMMSNQYLVYDPVTGRVEEVLAGPAPSYPRTGMLPFTPSLVSLRPRRPRHLVPPSSRRCHLVSLPRRCHRREGHHRKAKRLKSDAAPQQQREEAQAGRTPRANGIRCEGDLEDK